MIDEKQLLNYFKERLQREVSMAKLTTSRVGGPARFYVIAATADQLAEDVSFLWEHQVPFFLLGSGANILVSDKGLDMLVLHNQARKVTVASRDDPPSVIAESGAILTSVARTAAEYGLSGLEWASTVPGTVGGAVYGNAGAFGSDVAHCLLSADVLQREGGRVSRSSSEMGYAYRSSVLKRQPGQSVILSARFEGTKGDPEEILATMNDFSERRRNTQPAGASTGSTFKNPPGDFAGRLIEVCGLKGTRIGGVQISPLHANFFINDGTGTARDYFNLIKLVQHEVRKKFDIELETEIEWIGDWRSVD